MKTGTLLINDLERAGFQPRPVFRHPYVHIVLCNEAFAEQPDREDREEQVSARIGWSVAELRKTLQRANFLLVILTPSEFEGQYPLPRERGQGWLREIVRALPAISAPITAAAETGELRILHGYGYKGGQARSTVLAMLGRQLALDGWRVLMVDADLDASSLDLMFGCRVSRIEGTLLGLSYDAAPIPERIHTSLFGHVDLFACRPSGEEYDIEAMAFAMRCGLDTSFCASIAARVREYGKRSEYDVILVDHRAGLSPYLFPWLHELPGPVGLFVRLDDQWRAAASHLQLVLGAHAQQPNLFISFKMDEERMSRYLERNQGQIEDLLNILLDARGSHEGPLESELSAEDLIEQLVIWPHDEAFRGELLPETTSTGRAIADAMRKLRQRLGVEGSPQRKMVRAPVTTPALHPSGAADQGIFIQTGALDQLLSPASSIRYIFGRKGTGKTRLVQKLSEDGLAEPLFVDPEAFSSLGSGGVAAGVVQFERAVAACQKFGSEDLWRLLFACALRTTDTRGGRLLLEMDRMLADPNQMSPSQLLENLVSAAKIQARRRVFLLDGLEVAFAPEKTFAHIDGLFRVLKSLQHDPQLSEKMDFKLFLRTDLAEGAVQNIEQATYGQRLYLRWDIQAIFNFVLSRIAQRRFYLEHFAATVRKIRAHDQEIRSGRLDVNECIRLLQSIFPERLPNGLQTDTFLKTYFTDSVTPDSVSERGLEDSRATFYPRIYERFLEVIAHPEVAKEGRYVGSQLLADGRISGELVNFAHADAARDFLSQVSQELNYLIQIDDDPHRNHNAVQSLLNAFDGLASPFEPTTLVGRLSEITGFSPERVRTAMDRMKQIGMFEDRPRHRGWWRAGRLFRSSLKMKLLR